MSAKHRMGKAVSFGAGLIAVGLLAVAIGYFMGNYAMRMVTGPNSTPRKVTVAPAPEASKPTTTPAGEKPKAVDAASVERPVTENAEDLQASPTQDEDSGPLKVELNDEKYQPAKETISAAEAGSHLYKVQVGEYSDRDEARQLAARLKDQGYVVYVTTLRPFRVQVGAFEAKDRADRLAAEVKGRGFGQVQVVR